MKLLVDFGNTRVKWAWLEDGELRDPQGFVHEGVTAQALAARMADGRTVDEVRVASVAAPERSRELCLALEAALRAPVHQAHTSAAAAGVRCAYHEPAQLGVDRWLAMVAAYAHHRSAACVVDAGTAWTIDVVQADGRHLGGLIVPGPGLMRRALLGTTGGIASSARLLPDSGDHAGAWGRDTDACMRLGAWRAGAALVESCMASLVGHGEVPVLVLSGGDAGGLMPMLSGPVHHHPLLVLEGLALPGMVAAD
ncbi:MAG: type III pantothenate kinase [Gammaproteobacteria bacterium]|nr:type III pantothenate kinase [Gammaproteobacteria bacterium]